MNEHNGDDLNVSRSWSNMSSNFINQDRNYFLLLLLIFPIVTVFGNLLVVLSVVKERYLRTTTNYYIVSLAIADISLAILVMPLCTWLEVNQGQWPFNKVFCDVFMMLDVMFCTSSILNLAAISVDRYFAVSRPLTYSHSKKWQRVYISIGLTWILSFLIALPVLSGLNNNSHRQQNECTFSNPNFIILSSLVSFYIPSILVLILYYRIFRVIRKQARSKRTKSSPMILVNPRNQSPDIKMPATPDHQCLLTANTIQNIHTNPSTSQTDSADERANNQLTISSNSPNDKFSNIKRMMKNQDYEDDEDEDEAIEKTSTASQKSPNLRSTLLFSTLHTANLIKSTISIRLPLLNKGRDNQEKVLAKRERKATKTLVIVLVVFLLCWAPFFTLNITHAVCLSINIPQSSVICKFSTSIAINIAVWLGYINSCLNPAIYTIFNVEFRKAFKKLLNI